MTRIVEVIALVAWILLAAWLPAGAQDLPNPELCPRFVGDKGGGFGEELLPPPPEEADDAAVLAKLKMGKDAIDTTAVSPSGGTIATATTSRQGRHLVQLWDGDTGRKLAETVTDARIIALDVAGNDRMVAAIQFDPDDYAYTTLLMRHDPVAETLVIEQQVTAGSWRAPLSFSPDGSLLAVATESRVDLWDTATGELRHRLTGDIREITVADPSGAYLAPYLFGGHIGPIAGLSFRPDGSRLLTSSGLDDATVRVWDVQTGEHLSCVEAPAPLGFIGDLILPKFTQDGDAVVAFDTATQNLYTWDATGRTLDHTVDLGRRIRFETADNLAYFDLSSDLDAFLIAAPQRNWVKVLDPMSGDIVGMLTLPGVPLALRFGAGGDTLLTAFSSAARSSVGSSGSYNEDEPSMPSAARGVWLWDTSHPAVARAGESRNLLAVGLEHLLSGEFQEARSALRRSASLGSLSGDEFEAEVGATVTAVARQRIDELLQDGRVDDTLAAAYNTQAYVGDAHLDLKWNTLCWRGALYGRPEDVLDACDRAVELDPDSGDATDSRGLARALVGDVDGAIADFEATLASWEGVEMLQTTVDERTNWLSMLYSGENPFDEQTLSGLRNRHDIAWPAVVTSDGKLNVREEPSTSGTLLKQLVPGSPLRIYGRNKDGRWLLVEMPGYRGWVAAQYVTMGQQVNLPVFQEQ